MQRNSFRTNGKSNYHENNYHKEEDESNPSIQTGNESDYILNSPLDQTKSTTDFDNLSSKGLKKRKSKFFSGLRKFGSKYSSQESH